MRTRPYSSPSNGAPNDRDERARVNVWRGMRAFVAVVVVVLLVIVLVCVVDLKSSLPAPCAVPTCPACPAPHSLPVASALCEDGDVCTADMLWQGSCQNPRLPDGTPCESNCYAGATACDGERGCAGAGCVGDCTEDLDCPELAWTELVEGDSYNRFYCHSNGSACLYYAALELPEPFDDFQYPSCGASQWALDKCSNLLQPGHPYESCLSLSVTCAKTTPFFGTFYLHCHWHFRCSGWNCDAVEVNFG